MGSKGSHRICEICGLRERHCARPLLFSRFPIDEDRCKQWLRVVGNEELVHLPIEKLNQLKHVCEMHFKKKDVTKNNRLKKRAIPALNLTNAPLSDDQLAGFPQHVMCKKRKAPLHEEVEPSTSQKENTKLKNSPSLENVKCIQQDNANILKPMENTKIKEKAKNAPLHEEVEPSTSQKENAKSRNEKTPTKSTKKICEIPGKENKGVKRNILETIDMTKPINAEGLQESLEEKRIKIKPEDESPEMPTQRGEPQGSQQNKMIKRKLEEHSPDVTPRKKKLIADLKKTRYTLKSLKKSANLVENINSPVLKEFVINACKNQNRKPRGRRWTTKNKISALAIFKRSPKTYRFLNKIMPLPSEKTLQNILKKVPMQPGINKSVLSHLQKICKNKNDKNKMCCLLFDEMALKPRLIYNMATDLVEGYQDLGEECGRSNKLADHALVFMLQGLCLKFKQPIAYYFVKGTISSEMLAKIIKDITIKVSATGFKVINTVCDQGPTNMGALKILRESSGPMDDGSNQYFILNNEKINIIYDVPHLFKSLRNNFQNYGTIVINGKKAQWSHLIQVEEKNRNFLFLSKISPVHVDPKYRAKMKVKYAAQILSNTVAAVLKLLSSAENDPQRSSGLMESALVIQDLDKLFDATNGPSGPDDVKKGQRQNVSAKTNHMDVWADYIKKMSTIKFKKNGMEARKVKCVSGFEITLKSLRDIWQILNRSGFSYLNLRQLNQDALENLFGVIRQHSPTNRNPTCAHFVAALKTAIVTKLAAPHSRGANCQKDDKVLLTDLHSFVFEENPKTASETENFVEVEETETLHVNNEFPVLAIPEEDEDIVNDLANIEEQPVVYVSGYLASRLLKIFNCQSCTGGLAVENPDGDIYNYIRLREWWENKKSLTYPSVALCRLVQEATTVTQNELCPRLFEPNICQMAVTLYSAKCDTKWFTCATHYSDVFKTLFSRLALLLIRRQCQKVNQSLANQEERVADIYKKAQQQGIAK